MMRNDLKAGLQRLSAAMTRAQHQRDRQTRNERLGRDPVTGRAVMFESTLPGGRQWRSPLGGRAVETKPKK
jgi:hypothetical protein